MLSCAKDYFIGRKLVIATMHGKEKVIAPLLKEALGVEIIVPTDLNTDEFGSFSGEIERKLDPLETARQKCKTACEKYDCTLSIASEGSFGPHPTMFFIPGDDEILVFLDQKNGLEIKSRELTTKTNFNGSLFYSVEDAKRFAKSVLFPDHALIVRKKENDLEALVKGINKWEHLEELVKTYIDNYGQVFLETDMRALYNPTRMSVIEQATRKLVDTILRQCPKCQTPGFDIAKVVDGLPCSQCGTPTRSTLAFVYECQKCKYTEEKKYPRGKTHEDPMYCDWCNP